jgi:hypothetical protein
MNTRRKRCLAVGIAAYLLLGMACQMGGEMRLAKKYAGHAGEAWSDPWAYFRAFLSSPFWPQDLYWTLRHCGDPFGCPLPVS